MSLKEEKQMVQKIYKCKEYLKTIILRFKANERKLFLLETSVAIQINQQNKTFTNVNHFALSKSLAFYVQKYKL